MSARSLPMPGLLDGERVVYTKDFNEPFPKKFRSSIRELERLSQAKNYKQIGEFGPVQASEALHNHISEPVFRRYEALFGRDSLRVALNLIDDYPKLARITIISLAKLQGVKTEISSEEEPGRILHEQRDPKYDPVAVELSTERGWGWPYYGSVDSTPEYIRTLTAYCRSNKENLAFLKYEYTGRDGKTHDIADSLKAAVGWVVHRLDANPEGLLEYKRSNPNGIENQVWKDSWDSYFHRDGTMANHDQGIASIEVQRVARDALLDAADFYERYFNDSKEAGELHERADNLRKQIINRFWHEDRGGFFVIGTDRDKNGKLRQLAIKASNMGHLLHSELLAGDEPDTVHYREAIIKQLFSKEMFGVNGIMTLANSEIRYRDGAYHDGSVWGWDNYFLAQGLRMLGYTGLADYVEQIMLEGITYSKRFVEYLRGGDDLEHRINTRIVDVWDENNQRVNRLEQPPQDMQAWTAAAVLAIKLRKEHEPVSQVAQDPAKRKLEKDLLGLVNERLKR